VNVVSSIGIVGLGRMGQHMASRIRARSELVVIGYDKEPTYRDVDSFDHLLTAQRPGERVWWLMLPMGAYESTLENIAKHFVAGDIVIDGGNTDWKVTQARSARFEELGIGYVDVGTSGGIFGEQDGYAVMVGATEDQFAFLFPLFNALAPDEGGMVHAGPSGAGHMAKSIHNAIEYGIMAAIAEGLAMLTNPLVLAPEATLASWTHGTIIESFLLKRAVDAMRMSDYESIAPIAADSGEGRWALRDALELGIPTPVISAALASRLASQGNADIALQLVAAIRREFGGHAVTSVEH
jgi:6-phosphogluconate dehydrogenase